MKTSTLSSDAAFAVLHSPDNGSTASVLVNGPLGRLYVQIIDAYGFQREMYLRKTDEPMNYFGEWTLHVYQHPGRRDSVILDAKQTDKFIARITDICERSPHVLFNVPSNDSPRCRGFVHLCESLHLGALSIADILRDL